MNIAMKPETRAPFIPEFFNPDHHQDRQIERGPFALKGGNIYFHQQNISSLLTGTEGKFLTALLILPTGATPRALAKAHEESTGTPYPHDAEKLLNNLKVQKSKLADKLRTAFPDLPILDIGSFNPTHRRGEKGPNTIHREQAGYFIPGDNGFKPRLAFRRVAADAPRIPVIPECLKDFESATASTRRGNFALNEDETISFCGRTISGLLSPMQNTLLTSLIRHGSVTPDLLKETHEKSSGAAYPHHSADVQRYLAAQVSRMQRTIRTAHPDLSPPDIRPESARHKKGKGYYIEGAPLASPSVDGAHPSANRQSTDLTAVPDCFGQFGRVSADARRNVFSLEGSMVLYHGKSTEGILDPGERRFLKGLILSEQGVTPFTINRAYEKTTGEEHPYHPLDVLNVLGVYTCNIRKKLRKEFPDHPEPDIRPLGPAFSAGEKGACIPRIHQGYFLPDDVSPKPQRQGINKRIDAAIRTL